MSFAATATWLTLAHLRDLSPVDGAPFTIPWWALALGFAAAEIFIINFERGSQTHSFSMVEIPMVAGLYFTNPVHLVVARLVAGVLVLAGYRRQTPLKLAFNLSLFFLETTVGIAVFHAIGGPSVSVRPSSWPAPFAACMVLNLVGVIGVTL